MLAQQLGVDRARGHGVDRDAAAREFLAKLLVYISCTDFEAA